MKIIVGLFIFCVILFLYLHVTFQLRTSNDLDVYEIEANSKDRLEEICDVRQPVLFSYSNQQFYVILHWTVNKTFFSF